MCLRLRGLSPTLVDPVGQREPAVLAHLAGRGFWDVGLSAPKLGKVPVQTRTCRPP